MDRSDADSSACERWDGCGERQEVEGEGSSHVKSDSPCQSQEGSLDQMHDQEGVQVSSHRTVCELDQKNVPFLCRLRVDCRNLDQDSIFLQEYRHVLIRQEDIGVDVHDKRYPMPFMCGSSHMPRKEEGSAQKRTKPQTPAPKGDTSLADERVKADRETQRRERGQAKQRALQHASVPAKASMRGHGTESESTIVRKRPAQSEDETPSLSESGALPATLAEREMSPSATTTDPQQAKPAEESQLSHTGPQQTPLADESQPSQANPQQVDRPIEETTPIQSGEASIQESLVVKKRVVKKGSAAVAEQGSITDLRSHDTSASSAGEPKSVSTSEEQREPKPVLVPRPPSSPKAASAPKSVSSPKATSAKAAAQRGQGSAVASPIAASPKAAASRAASPKSATAKTATLPKTTSVPKALSPLGTQTPSKATAVPKETVPKKRTQWSELEDDPNESVPKSAPKANQSLRSLQRQNQSPRGHRKQNQDLILR